MTDSEAPTLDSAFQVLNYNQQLIQFADAKAGNLIVINSLFIAASQQMGSNFWLLKLLQCSLLGLSGLALLACLAVIMSRGRLEPLPRRDCIFYEDISQRKTMGHFTRDFLTTSSSILCEDALRRSYILAQIARRKFATFSQAQLLTALAAVLWLGHGGVQIFC
jgi:hypothetical protein